MFQYENELKREQEAKNRESLNEAGNNCQKDLNSRLDNCYIRYLTASDFESSAPHDSKQVSFVSRDNAIEIWKGDIRIMLNGGAEADAFMLLLASTLTPSS